MSRKQNSKSKKSADRAPSAAGETTVLDAAAIDAALARMCRQIAADLPGQPDCPVALVGLRSRGDELAGRLIKCISSRCATGGLPASARSRPDLLHGTLDITLYRDDLSKRAVQPTVRATELPFDLDGAFVILVDDVLHTGRTIRSAMDALMDYGRPAVIRLAVLVDRGGRELPIAPDYVGAKLDLPPAEPRRVYLELTETDGRDRAYLK